jgi:TolB-like protein
MRCLIATFVLMTALAARAADGAPAKVLLLPFESVGPADKQWVAKALQQNLVAELSRVNSVHPVTADQPAADVDTAMKVASPAGADFVIFGGYQVVDGDLRITGQVIDVAKKQPVAGLKTTGTLRDLFGMEDAIASQVKKALPTAIPVAGPEMLRQPPAQAPIPALDQREPITVNQRTKDLEDQIDRAIQRLRNAPAFGGYDYPYYGGNYFYSGAYTPYYAYPVFVGGNCFRQNRGCNFGGSGISGSFRSGSVSGAYHVGGAGYVTGFGAAHR